MIKRLIFDIDGTLIRGVSFTPAIIKTLKELNIYSEENVIKFSEAINTYENYYDNYNLKDYNHYFSEILNTELSSDFPNIFFTHLKEAIPKNNNDVKETIAYLSTKYELVLLSNYFETSQRNRLEKMGINKYFSEFYGEKKIKPQKEAYLFATGSNNIDECLIIGDNLELDIKKPLELGFKTILISANKNIDVAPNVRIITNISELKAIL